MSFERIDVGALELFALLDADGDIDEAIDASFPGWPEGELLRYREHCPAVYGANGSWHLMVRAWLVNHPSGPVLIDTGIGAMGSPGSEWFGSGGHLHDALAEAGTSAASIGTVVISHFHDDHVGGTVLFTGADGGPQPAFPNARHVVQRADLDAGRPRADSPEWVVAGWDTSIAPLESAGLFDVVEGDADLMEGIAVHHLPGHTPGHQIVRLSSGAERAVIVADALMHPAQIPHPEWRTSNDEDVIVATESRIALLSELAAHPETVVAPTHFGEAFGTLVPDADGRPDWSPIR